MLLLRRKLRRSPPRKKRLRLRQLQRLLRRLHQPRQNSLCLLQPRKSPRRNPPRQMKHPPRLSPQRLPHQSLSPRPLLRRKRRQSPPRQRILWRQSPALRLCLPPLR